MICRCSHLNTSETASETIFLCVLGTSEVVAADKVLAVGLMLCISLSTCLLAAGSEVVLYGRC